MTTFSRNAHIAQQLVFVDGIPGSGKSLIGPILASYDRVEKYRLESIYEYVCQLYALQKIESDAATSLLNIYADQALYHLSISREINFRPTDNTGIFKAPQIWRYFKRLLQKDGPSAIARIQHSNPILQTNTHAMLLWGSFPFHAFGNRLTMIEMLRHPTFLIPHWLSYVDLFGENPRDITLWLQAKTGIAPIYAHGWEDEYTGMKRIDKVIYMLNSLFERLYQTISQLSFQQQQQVFLIPFEKFVLEPWGYLEALEKRLDLVRTSRTLKTMKKHKCPRQVVTAGKGVKRYQWKKPARSASSQSELKRIRELVDAEASSKSKQILKRMNEEYEQRFQISF